MSVFLAISKRGIFFFLAENKKKNKPTPANGIRRSETKKLLITRSLSGTRRSFWELVRELVPLPITRFIPPLRQREEVQKRTIVDTTDRSEFLEGRRRRRENKTSHESCAKCQKEEKTGCRRNRTEACEKLSDFQPVISTLCGVGHQFGTVVSVVAVPKGESVQVLGGGDKFDRDERKRSDNSWVCDLVSSTKLQQQQQQQQK